MIKCELCNKKFYDVFLDETEKGEERFCCGVCYHEKIKHRVYIDVGKVKETEPKKIQIKETKDNVCSGCKGRKKLYVKFGKYQFCLDCSSELYF